MLLAAALITVGLMACKPIEPQDAEAFARAAAPRLLTHFAAHDPQKNLPAERHVHAFFRRMVLADAAVVAEATSIGDPIIGPSGEDLGLRTVEFTTRKVLLGHAPNGWTSRLAATNHCAVEAPAQGTQAFTLIAGDGAEVNLVRGLPALFLEINNQKVKLWGFEVPVRVLRRIIAAAHKEVTQ